MAGKRMTAAKRTNARLSSQPGGTESFIRLIRLSLGRLLLSRACLSFTGPEKSALPASERHGNFKTRQTRLPGRGIQTSCAVTTEAANPLEITTITRQNRTSRTSIRLVHQTVHLLVLTRPSVAGFNAPPDKDTVWRIQPSFRTTRESKSNGKEEVEKEKGDCQAFR
jgi:hypothetical protein